MCLNLNRQQLSAVLTSAFKAPALLSVTMLLSACALSSGAAPRGMTPIVRVPETVASAAPAAAVVPAEAQQQFDKALLLLRAGQTASATQQLQQLAAGYPAFAGPLINLGLIELKGGRYDAAAKLFQQALERDARSTAANNYLGVSYRYLGRFKEAEAAYQAAIAADETYPAAHLNLGVLYDLYLQQPESALQQYERYQSLLDAPDAKVSGWIKELSSRLNADKKARPAAGGAQP
ncbi:MAG: tetratricopeptide repeat protein [Steroidobacteraceae bacterium]